MKDDSEAELAKKLSTGYCPDCQPPRLRDRAGRAARR